MDGYLINGSVGMPRAARAATDPAPPVPAAGRGGRLTVKLERFIDSGRKFLPDRLTLIGGFDFLSPGEQRLVSQVQGRSYASMLGVLLRHQPHLQRLEAMMAGCMPEGYRFVPDPGVVDAVVRSRSVWSVLALTCLIGLQMRSHHRLGEGAEGQIDAQWADALRRQGDDAARSASLDERKWRLEDARLDPAARDRATGDFIVLLGMIDGVLQGQAHADANYFASACARSLHGRERARVEAALLNAYRWQYILSGVQVPHFSALLTGMLSAEQHGRVASALAPLFDRAGLPELRWS
ncbi:MAG TPA: hypothetical protein VLV90_06660 [Burkholderiales bacterium]|nr:hypothetical protein [Burkholderiales bacterium]